MSQSFMDKDRVVGYEFENKKLIVTLSEKMARKMRADGWTIGWERAIGFFIIVQFQEGEDAPDPQVQ